MMLTAYTLKQIAG